MHGTLRDIRQRLRATRKVLQVTRALERISSARMLKSRALLAAHQPYTQGLQEVMAGLCRTAGTAALPLLKAPPPGGRTALLVIGADRGLCGGFNQTLMETLERFVETHGRQATALIIMGKVVRDRARRLGFTVDGFFPQPPLSDYEACLGDMIRIAAAGFRSGQYGQVFLLYTALVSSLRHVPTVTRLVPLPFAAAEAAPPSAGERQRAASEPDAETLLRGMMPEFLRATVSHALLNSLACEHTARNASMTRASDNAKDMIDALTVEHNRLRQEGITTEMTEIAAGGMA